VAGFIASIYMRGVECRYVPTTLLGAVDASIGGKTAVNVGGKNLLGTFNHPSRVVIDIDVLERLTSELLSEGMAEAYKTGLIGDVQLAAQIERDGLAVDLESVVAGSIAVKSKIVEADFREAGRRAHLNFGHTVGHAIERLTAWRHGPSVAVGMVAAAAISEATLGFGGRAVMVDTIERLGLPVSVIGVTPEEIERLVAFDKKGDSQGLKMVLLEGVGAPTVRYVDSATLALGLQAIGIT
jgi:3-dehydroquinate synthetase